MPRVPPHSHANLGTGPMGPPGPEGPAGPAGADGAPGADAILATYTTATLPAAGATYTRKLVTVKDPGVDEKLYWCQQKADGSYTWKLIA